VKIAAFYGEGIVLGSVPNYLKAEWFYSFVNKIKVEKSFIQFVFTWNVKSKT